MAPSVVVVASALLLLLPPAHAASSITVKVLGMGGTALKEVQLAVTDDTTTMSGADLMTELQAQGKLDWTSAALGGKLIAAKIAGQAHALPRTAWILTHTVQAEASDEAMWAAHREWMDMISKMDEKEGGEEDEDEEVEDEEDDEHSRFGAHPSHVPGLYPNVGMEEITVRPGDTLEWRLYDLASAPKRRRPRKAASPPNYPPPPPRAGSEVEQADWDL